jgi:hypothetical protein
MAGEVETCPGFSQFSTRSPRPYRLGWPKGILALAVLLSLAILTPIVALGQNPQWPEEAIPSVRIYVPVTFRWVDGSLTGLSVLNNGPGEVTIDLGETSRFFMEHTRSPWWFPIGSGQRTATAYSSSGPCAALVSLGGNIYQIEIDFTPDELGHINFICLDTSRPPDGTGWMLYYYLEE